MMVGKGFLPQRGLGNWRQSLVKCFQGLGGKGVWLLFVRLVGWVWRQLS